MLLLPTLAKAQFQVNVMGTRATSVMRGGADGLWGGGATLRYFTNPHIAIGLNGRYFGDKYSFSFGNFSSSSRITTIAMTGQAEYFFDLIKERLQPYVGLEAGLYTSRYNIEYTGINLPNNSISAISNDFGAIPKVGLQYAITPAIGVNAEAGYQLVFGSGSIGQSLLLNLGAFYKFGRQQ
jgi:outer membrane protein W